MANSLYETIRFTKAGGVAHLTLARPESLNALNRVLLSEVMQVLDDISAGGDVRVLLVDGDGRGFSSGADLGSDSSSAGDPDFDAGAVLEQFYNPLIERMFALPVPIVCAVHGPVVGAGCMIALSADIVLAAKTAYFLQAFVNVGLVPDAGSTWLLPRLVGRARAQAMMMLGERIPAQTAADWGLIYEAVDDGDLAARAHATALKLATGPTRAYRLIRRGIRSAFEQSLSDALTGERVAQAEAGSTEDFREGVAAFREKRRPVFRGR
jgi:2-(1,2-epoxy-1,2-dihydrophenyl)acetyl-CoA isomerase